MWANYYKNLTEDDKEKKIININVDWNDAIYTKNFPKKLVNMLKDQFKVGDKVVHVSGRSTTQGTVVTCNEKTVGVEWTIGSRTIDYYNPKLLKKVPKEEPKEEKKFKVGDRVLLVNRLKGWDTISNPMGDVGTVYEVGDWWCSVIWDMGQKNEYPINSGCLRHYEEEFKVGDRVSVNPNNTKGLRKHVNGFIDKIDDEDHINVSWENGILCFGYKAEDLIKIEPTKKEENHFEKVEKKKEPKEHPEFKIGDRVHIRNIKECDRVIGTITNFDSLYVHIKWDKSTYVTRYLLKELNNFVKKETKEETQDILKVVNGIPDVIVLEGKRYVVKTIQRTVNYITLGFSFEE